MNKKLEYLKKVAKPIKSKISLGKMNELNSLIEELRNYDIPHATEQVNEYYDKFLTNLRDTEAWASELVELYGDFLETLDDHWDLFKQASDLATEIELELEDLGIERSPEFDEYISEIIVAEEEGQTAFAATQNDYPEYNTAVDISPDHS